MSDLITIHSDHGPVQLPAGSTLATALTHILSLTGQDAHGVATAVNGVFVPRASRASHPLADGDAVLCFSPITGG
ncbi:MAG: MoaD/ThiS family protein [Aquabacterium sp.]|jgi:sulfur carrier protein|uniref:sulfur carrier protein ThiS n=1 Tax=Aquabacterium sp. TaxID=1872578 RepID=UPI002A35D767|nr:MoaD/ThiS family protein [Aquabacterium sp.]MDX9842625.1 MoaD/ThiS family protein [Aquabacterium sp.]